MTVTILVGDVREKLRTLPADSFDCVVTSPPYWGLRDYGTGRWVGGDPDCDHRSPTMRDGRDEDRAKLPGSDATNSHQLKLAHRSACGKCGAVKVDQQIGLEPTMAEHIAVMVDVFREVRRVLKPTGTLWLNYGDCYATSPNGRSAADTKAAGNDDRTFRDKPFSTIGGALKAKDLCMIPNRLAIALQEDGWWVRSEIVWGKPNPMPESIKDRPATAHEKIFLLAKSSRYFYEADEVRQGRVGDEDANTFRGGSYVQGEPGPRKVVGNKRIGKQAATAAAAAAVGGSSGRRMAGFNERWDAKEKLRASDLADPRHIGHINHTGIEEVERGSRSLRNWEPAPLHAWVMGTAPFSEAHFATFPPELVERCLTAGCPKGVCPDCGGVLEQRTINAIRSRTNGNGELSGVRQGSDRGSSGPTEEILQQGVLIAVDCKTSVDDQGLHGHIEGIRGNSPTQPSERIEGRLRAGTPIGDGEEDGSAAAPDGSGSPQGRDQVAQYRGQLGSADERGPRSASEGADGHHSLPPLLGQDQNFPSCPHCGHALAQVAAGRVLDPFGGAGTTALVADQMQLDCTIIELNPDYVHIAIRRIEGDRGAIQNTLDPLTVDMFGEAV